MKLIIVGIHVTHGYTQYQLGIGDRKSDIARTNADSGYRSRSSSKKQLLSSSEPSQNTEAKLSSDG